MRWPNGLRCMRGERLRPPLFRSRRLLHEACVRGTAKPCGDGHDWAHHIYREYDNSTDALATKALLEEKGGSELYDLPLDEFGSA